MFFNTKYDEKKIASFNQMNTLLRCVLLFFILGAGAALYMSYTAVLPSSPEDLQTIEGRVIYVQTNKSRGASYYRLNLVDSALKQRRFSLDVYSTEIDGYRAAIYDKDVKIWYQRIGGDTDLARQIALKDGQMVLKYDYAFAIRFYYNTISDSYKITYLKWGGGALALLIVQIVLTRIARRKYRVKWGYYEKPTNKI